MIINMTGGGGGAALNFKVVPGLTQPGTASDNTIWVKTEQIGYWYFSATQPEGLQEWDVWFQTGTESKMEFNALRKNGLQVYPLIAKQMISGSLVGVDAMSYQGGQWVDLVTYLYKDGKQFEDITGGWTGVSGGGILCDFDDSGIVFSAASGARDCTAYTKKKIDFTDINTLYATVTANKHGNDFGKIRVALSTQNSGTALSDSKVSAFADVNIVGTTEVELNVSGILGSYYVGVYADIATGAVNDIYIE